MSYLNYFPEEYPIRDAMNDLKELDRLRKIAGQSLSERIAKIFDKIATESPYKPANEKPDILVVKLSDIARKGSMSPISFDWKCQSKMLLDYLSKFEPYCWKEQVEELLKCDRKTRNIKIDTEFLQTVHDKAF